ncbi:MAG: phage portal protein [Solirubrobacterales bacterium]|nr:phage portal protein [Solirubrobacterales bacterium]
MARWQFWRKSEDRSLKLPELYPSYGSFIGREYTTDPIGRQALALSDVWAAVKLLADTISTLPMEVYRDTPAGRQPVGADAIISRLLAAPAPGSTLPDLLASIVVSMALHGEAFIGKYSDPSGQVAQLGVIDPAAVSVRLHGRSILYSLALNDVTNGLRIDVGSEDVLHIKSSVTTPDGLRGLSPIATCRMALGVNAGLAASAKSFIQNGSRPSGILTVQGAQDEHSVQTISDQWNTKHGGGTSAGKVAVVSGDVSYTQLGLSAEDAQFVEQRALSTKEIARIFGLPAWSLGESSGDSLTYSNVQQEARALVMFSLRPLLTRIETAISSDPYLCPGGTRVRFSLDELLRADPAERAQFYTAALNAQTGWLTRDEVRELEGLEPDSDDTDVGADTTEDSDDA